MIELACATDAGFLPHTAVMLDSAMRNTPGTEFRVHLLHAGDLGAGDHSRLHDMLSKLGGRLELLEVSAKALGDLPVQRFHPACWYRVLLPELAPALDKILYLDSDLIVTDSLLPLWETNLSRYPFAAVTNPLYPFMMDWPRHRLGIPDAERYINSGVLLLNLAHMRTRKTVERIRQYARQHPENDCPEQDALGALFHSECLLLHPRWNVQTTLYDLKPVQLPFPEIEVRDALARPAIIHFIGPFKPWHYLCKHPQRGLYGYHRAHTPWPMPALEGRTLVNRLLRPLPLSWQRLWILRVATARRCWRRLSSLLGALQP